MTIHIRSTVPFRVAAVLVTMTAASFWIDHPSGAQAVAVDRGIRDYTLPAQMQWRDTESGKAANLYGDPSRPGLYAYVLKRGPNVWSTPHSHDKRLLCDGARGHLVGRHRNIRSAAHRCIEGRLVRQDVAGGIVFDGRRARVRPSMSWE